MATTPMQSMHGSKKVAATKKYVQHIIVDINRFFSDTAAREGLLPERLVALNPFKNLPNKCGIEPAETTWHSCRASRIIHAEKIREK
jgi:hypothetical protein